MNFPQSIYGWHHLVFNRALFSEKKNSDVKLLIISLHSFQVKQLKCRHKTEWQDHLVDYQSIDLSVCLSVCLLLTLSLVKFEGGEATVRMLYFLSCQKKKCFRRKVWTCRLEAELSRGRWVKIDQKFYWQAQVQHFLWRLSFVIVQKPCSAASTAAQHATAKKTIDLNSETC